jgi:hypothetical protein
MLMAFWKPAKVSLVNDGRMIGTHDDPVTTAR